MGFLDKAKEAAEQATAKAKQGVDEVQSKRQAFQAYGELGRETYRLIEAGEITNPELTAIADRIREAEDGGGDGATQASETEAPGAGEAEMPNAGAAEGNGDPAQPEAPAGIPATETPPAPPAN